MKEIWLPLKNFPDYEVSNLGQVRSLKRNRPKILCPFPNKQGYLRVALIHKSGQRKHLRINRLVLLAFKGSPKDGQRCARHLNDVPDDNRLSNLEWGTYQENYLDRKRNGNDSNGERNSQAKLNWDKVNTIRQSDKSNAALSREYKVCATTIGRVRKYQIWKGADIANGQQQRTQV